MSEQLSAAGLISRSVHDSLESLSVDAPLSLQWTVHSDAKSGCCCGIWDTVLELSGDGWCQRIMRCRHVITQEYRDGTVLSVAVDGSATLELGSATLELGSATLELGSATLELGDQDASGAPWWSDPRVLLRLNQDALILQQLAAGRVVLHGSAIAVDGHAAVTIGPSGAGKSTTAMALLRMGGELLADDIVVVDVIDGEVMILPSESRPKGAVPDMSAVLRSAKAPTPLGLITALSAHDDSDVRLEWSPGTTPTDASDSAERSFPPLGQTAESDEWLRLRGGEALATLWEFGGGERGLHVFGYAGYTQRLAAITNAAPVWRLRRQVGGLTPGEIAGGILRRMPTS